MKNNFNLKTMFTLFLAAPFLVIIVMIFIFMGLAESRSTMLRSLEAPKYLIDPIISIIENNYTPEGEVGGILMLLDGDGKILYPPIADKRETLEIDFSLLYSKLLSSGMTNISITRYVYNGEPGLCFFDNTYVPAVLKQHIRIGISLFIIIISCLGLIFGQVSTVIINNSIKTLVDASDLIANGNLDETITLKYNNELVHVAKAIDRMRVELREKRNMEQRFVMSVTHDLKTPLTSINGYLEAINDGIISDPGEIKESIVMMQKKTDLLDSRINELLDYTKDSTAGWRDQWREINVFSWLHELSSMFENDAQLCSRKFVSSINMDRDVTIKCNDKLMTRALENLFDNACRYTESEDSIFLTATAVRDSDKIRLEIIMEDSGSGIDEKDRDKIFELFYRNDRGRNSRGMGIGLASVQTIVKDHGGKISCGESQWGGAKFAMELEFLLTT
ncbi:MAG: HAMP domain-containing histidine kinase [Spirochaetaceae bacterium]|nr:HAMP domain-containing histidine kinase [Spirochaetaceae bacterium]